MYNSCTCIVVEFGVYNLIQWLKGLPCPVCVPAMLIINKVARLCVKVSTLRVDAAYIFSHVCGYLSPGPSKVSVVATRC